MKFEQEKNKVKLLFRNWKMQWGKLRKLYLIQFVYLTVFYRLLAPASMRTVELLLKRKGYSYITAEMMLAFFTSPEFIGLFVVEVLLVGVVVAILQVFSYEYIESIYNYGEAKVIPTFIHTIFTCGRMVRQKNFNLFFQMSGGILFQNVLCIFLVCRYIPSVWYVMKNFFALPYTIWFVRVLFFILAMVYVRHSFTMPYIICEKQPYREAKKNSWKLCKKDPVHILGYWIVWNMVTGLLALSIYAIGMVVGATVVSLFISAEMRIAVLCTIQGHLHIVGILVSILLGMNLQTTGKILGYYFYEHESHEQKKIEKTEENGETLWKHRKLWAMGIVLVLCIDIYNVYDQVANGGNVTFEHLGQITISSHRGASKDAPENTLPAIEMALDTAADYIEIDVQETKDGEVVLMHDATLARTTGVNKKVSDLTLEEIQQLDAGSWYGDEFVGVTVPTLREVLEVCKGHCKLNIEIKANKAMPDLEEKVVALIEEYDFTRQCVVTSVYKQSLKKVKKLNKEIQTGYILSSAYGRYYLDKEIDFLSMRSTLITERVVRLSHKYGKEVCVWTINTKNEAIRMSQLGVDNIITDRPTYVRNVLYKERGNHTLLSLLKLTFDE